ncbi:nucleotide exchange factor GrpE [Woeseiaceae bacterium]|nr:nucleotide exchange factor GrpE [Woeseiaceae bacterium]
MKGKANKKSPAKSDDSIEDNKEISEGISSDHQENDGDELIDEKLELSLEDKLELTEKKAEDNWDKYLRAVAELENVRKRVLRDVENARKFALESFSRELLSVSDSLELAVNSENLDADSLRSGNEATLQLMLSTMGQFGFEVIDPHGEPFDAEYHEAISMQPSDQVEPGSVITVFQKGYTLNKRLLRPARVVVAANSED